MRKYLFLLYIFLIILFWISPVQAEIGGVFPRFSWSGRYYGTSLEGVSLNDPFAITDNPAYSQNISNKIGIEQRDIFGMKYTALSLIKDDYGSYLIINQSPDGLEFNYNTYRWGNVYALNWRDFTVGVKGELLALTVTEVPDQSDYNASGYNVELGFDYRNKVQKDYVDEIFISLLAANIYNQLEYSTGTAEAVARPGYGLALGGKRGGLTAAFNLEKEEKGGLKYNLGLDYVYDEFSEEIIDSIDLGLGYNSDRTISAGFGVGFRGYKFNYGYRFDKEEIQQTISTSFSY